MIILMFILAIPNVSMGKHHVQIINKTYQILNLTEKIIILFCTKNKYIYIFEI